MATPTMIDGFLRAIERAETPFVLFPEDIGTQFRLPDGQARTAMRLGLFGPWFLVAGEPAVLRDTLRAHLADRASSATPLEREVLPFTLTGPEGKEGRDGS